MADDRLMELIETAIRREEQAYKFYTDISAAACDESAKQTILEIAGEEKKHKAFLVKYRDESMAPEDLQMSEVTYYKIAEYQKEPEIQKDMKSEDVYLIASHRELRSYRFYSELSELHGKGDLGQLLGKMANEELRHKEKMEYLYANTAFPQTDGG